MPTRATSPSGAGAADPSASIQQLNAGVCTEWLPSPCPWSFGACDAGAVDDLLRARYGGVVPAATKDSVGHVGQPRPRVTTLLAGVAGIRAFNYRQ